MAVGKDALKEELRAEIKEELRAEIEEEIKAKKKEKSLNKTTHKEVELMDGNIITMRPPKLIDLRIANSSSEGNELDMKIILIGNLTGLTKKEMDEMPLYSFSKLQGAFDAFLS